MQENKPISDNVKEISHDLCEGKSSDARKSGADVYNTSSRIDKAAGDLTRTASPRRQFESITSDSRSPVCSHGLRENPRSCSKLPAANRAIFPSRCLIIGLGNPGTAYSQTRHNVGFMALDALAGPDAVWKKEKNALVAKQGNIIFAKPQTFMNLSGVSVQALMTFYKVPLENLVVIHDDMDLKLGDAREKTGGSSAGHNGIKSIDAAIGNEYHRIRIGVGRVSRTEMDPSDWVLGRFSAEELKKIKEVLEKIVASR